jgi:Lon protease-like protein
MLELPLFPLNTVLFPGIPINLHIFEERYKQMIEVCSSTQQPFGVVLIDQGAEAFGPLAKPHPIGCTAQITHIEHLDDGRLNILAVGLDRFLIRELDYDQEPYLIGTVELLPLELQDSRGLAQAGHCLRPWVERYLGILAQFVDNLDFDPHRLPDDPLALAHLAASVVQIPAEQKQTLLAADGAIDLLTEIGAIYRREVALLNAIVERDIYDDPGLFSAN